MKFFRRAILITGISLIAAELLLRVLGWFNTYNESIGQPYVSGYGAVLNSWYYTRTPNSNFVPPNTDFHFPYATNSLGLRDKEYGLKSDSTFRILITGNSFEEGVGAPYDSTWPRLLEKQLKQSNSNVEVINAGISGSDVFFDYVLFRDKLKAYHPNLVIATIDRHTYNNYFFRGGMERFKEDGYVHYNPVPWYDVIYHYSHLFRAALFIAGYPVKGMYLSKGEYEKLSEEKATPEIASVMRRFKDQAGKDSTSFVLVIYPTPLDIFRQNSTTATDAKNLMQLQVILGKDVRVINIYEALIRKWKDVSWQTITYQHDKHFNSTGYTAMAQAISDSLIKNELLRQP